MIIIGLSYRYALGGSVIFNTIIADCTVINIIIDGIFKPDYLVPILCAIRAPTQRHMNEMVRMTNVLFLPFRVQILIKTLSLCLLFSACMPFMMPLLIIFTVRAFTRCP